MEEELILSEERRVQLDGIVGQMEANNETKQDIQFVVDDFKQKYGKKKISDTEDITSELEDGVSEPSVFEFDNTTKTHLKDGSVTKVDEVPDHIKKEIYQKEEPVYFGGFTDEAIVTPFPVALGADKKPLTTIPFGEDDFGVYVDSEGKELYEKYSSIKEELDSLNVRNAQIAGSKVPQDSIVRLQNEIFEKQKQFDDIKSKLQDNVDKNKIVQSSYNYDVLNGNEDNFDAKIIYSLPAESYFGEPADLVFGRGLTTQELNENKLDLLFERSNNNFGIVNNVIKNISEEDNRSTVTNRVIKSVKEDLESNMIKYLSDEELALAKLRTKAYELDRQIQENPNAENIEELISSLDSVRERISSSTSTKPFFNIDGSRRDAPIPSDDEKLQEFNNQVELNYQMFDPTDRGQLLTIYERYSSAQKQLEKDFEELTYRNTISGKDVSIKEAMEKRELDMSPILAESIEDIMSYMGVLPRNEENARRVVLNYQNLYKENQSKLIAITRLLGTNTDPGTINKGGLLNLKLFGESLAEGFGGIFIDDYDIKTDADYINAFGQIMKENGLELSESQEEQVRNDISDMVASGLGTSIPIMLEIMLTRKIPVAVLSKLRQTARYKNLSTYLSSYGTPGKFALNLGENVFTGGVSFGLTTSEDVSVAMGVGEGTAGAVFDTFFPKSKAYRILRSIFGDASARGINIGAYSVRVLGGGTGELVAEYSGDMLNNLTQKGLDWEKALEETFGRTEDEVLDKLIATAITCTMFSMAFNTGMLNLTMDEINSRYGDPNQPVDVQDAVKRINELIQKHKNSEAGQQLSLFDVSLYNVEKEDNPFVSEPTIEPEPEIDTSAQIELDLFTEEANTFASEQVANVLNNKIDGNNNINLGRLDVGMSTVKIQKAVNDYNNDVQSDERTELENALKKMYDSGDIKFLGTDGKKVVRNSINVSELSNLSNEIKVTNDQVYEYNNSEFLEQQYQLNMESTKNGTVEGGTTFNDIDGNLFGQKKFAVSIFPDLSVTKQKGEGTFTKEEIAAFKEKHKNILDGNKNLAVGTYTSPETGISYLDVTAIMSDAATAQKLAIQYNQESYFDLERGEEIRTGGTGAPIEGMESVEQRVADIETLEISESKVEKLLGKISKYKNNIDELGYSDPFLATATVRAGLDILEKAIKAGVKFSDAIQQAVDYIKANKPEGEIFDEIQFRNLFTDKPNNSRSSSTTNMKNRNSEGIVEVNENELDSEPNEIVENEGEPETVQTNRPGDASRVDSAIKKRKSDYEKSRKKFSLEEFRRKLNELGFDENYRIKRELLLLAEENNLTEEALVAIANRELQNGASAAAKNYAEDVVEKMDGGLGKSHISKEARELSDEIIENERIIALDKYYDDMKLEVDGLINDLSTMEVGSDSYNETLQKIEMLSGKMNLTFDAERGSLMSGENIVPEGLPQEEGAPIYHRIAHTVGVDGQMKNSEDAKAFLNREMENNPNWKRASERAEEYFEATSNLLKFKLEEGLITKETYDRLSKIKYSPRAFIEHMLDIEEAGVTDRTVENLSSPLKSLDGGSTKSLHNDATDLIRKQIAGTYKLAFKNRARKGLLEFINESVKNGKDISDFGYVIDNKNPKKDGYFVMDVLVDGEKVSMAIDQEMAQSFEGEAQNLKYSGFLRWVSGSQILKTFATGINPLFALTNFPRDFVHVIMSTDTYGTILPVSMAKMGYDIIKTLPTSISRGAEYKKAISQGLGMDFLTTQGKLSMDKGDSRTQKTAKSVFKALSWFGETSEVMVRMAVRSRQIAKRTAEFERVNGRKPNAKELEKIERLATNDSRQTMDFGKGGRWAKQADTVLPYLNASLQGFKVSAKYIKDNPGKSIFKITQLGATAMALTANNIMRYREDYDKISQYEKINNFIFMLPTKDEDGNRQYMRIRKDHFMIPFTTFFEDTAYEYMTGLNPNEGKHFSLFLDDEDKNNISKAWEMSMPLSGFDLSEIVMGIPVIDAFYAYKTNYDTFRDKQIYPGAEDIPDRLEYYRGTSKTYKQIGEAFDLSPTRLEVAVGKVLTDPRNNVYYQAFDGIYEEMTEGMDDSQIVEFDKTISKGWQEQLGEASYRTVVRSVPEFGQDESISIMQKAKQEENGKKKVLSRVKYFMADEFAKADEDRRDAILDNLFEIYQSQVSLELGYDVELDESSKESLLNVIIEATTEKEFNVSPQIARVANSMGRNPEAAAITFHYLQTQTAKKFGDPSPEMSKLMEEASRVGILKAGDTKFNRYLLNLKSEQNKMQE